MNAIFWLSVFAAVCSYGYFILNWFSLWATKKGWLVDKSQRSVLEYAAVNQRGVIHYMSFKWLFIGIGLTILAVNL
jgi:hypothetical protein